MKISVLKPELESVLILLCFSRGRTEEWKLNDTRMALNEKLGVTQELQGVFFDPKKKRQIQELVEKQSENLWKFILSKPPFEFKSIQDILDELHQCQTKTADDIKELKERTNDLMGKN